MAKALSEALRQARERRGLAPVEVAQALTSSPPTVASWEVGVAVPRLDSLVRLATVLGLGLGDLSGLFPLEGAAEGRYHRFAQALKAARERKRLSVAAAARAVGVSEEALARWERGRGVPQTWLVPRLARLLGWNLGELDAILGAPAAPPPVDLDEGDTTAQEEPERPVAAALGALLQSRRERQGWTRGQVCTRAGIGEPNLLRYEHGVTAPGAEMLGRLAYALDLDLGDFREVLSPWTAVRRRWEHLGLALRLARERRGWSREELAERAGLKVDVIARWEDGPKALHLTSLGRILAALGLSLGELEAVFDPDLPRERRFEQLGSALGAARALRGLERAELARRSGVAVYMIARWESGAVPSLVRFRDVVAALDVRLGDLDAALDEAVARTRAEQLLGVDAAAREQARALLSRSSRTPLTVESRVAALLAAVRELVQASAAAAAEGAGPSATADEAAAAEEMEPVERGCNAGDGAPSGGEPAAGAGGETAS
jgi:transcriptional regulator with XRE-family HTH domain